LYLRISPSETPAQKRERESGIKLSTVNKRRGELKREKERVCEIWSGTID
jgi:hypothetical protein